VEGREGEADVGSPRRRQRRSESFLRPLKFGKTAFSSLAGVSRRNLVAFSPGKAKRRRRRRRRSALRGRAGKKKLRPMPPTTNDPQTVALVV